MSFRWIVKHFWGFLTGDQSWRSSSTSRASPLIPMVTILFPEFLFFFILKELLFHPVILYVPNSHRIFSGILHIFLFFIYPFVLHPCHQILNRCLCLQIFKTEHLLWMCCPASHVGFLSSNTSVFHLKLEYRETHPQHTHHPPNELHWDTHTRVSSRHMLYSAV